MRRNKIALPANKNAALQYQLKAICRACRRPHIRRSKHSVHPPAAGKKGGVKTTLKTDAAFRDFDLHSALAKMLSDYIGDRKEGFLLQTRSGNVLSPESFFRSGLATIFRRMKRARVRFNAFRRFRESVLLRSECRQILIDYWMGHENPDMSARYGRQLIEDVKYRKEWAQKVGLGFDLPQAESPSDVNCATCATNLVEYAHAAHA